jgi:hypothetical protein
VRARPLSSLQGIGRRHRLVVKTLLEDTLLTEQYSRQPIQRDATKLLRNSNNFGGARNSERPQGFDFVHANDKA